MPKLEATHKVTIEFEGDEILMLRALAQNPHPAYQTSEELMEFAKELFTGISEVYPSKLVPLDPSLEI